MTGYYSDSSYRLSQNSKLNSFTEKFHTINEYREHNKKTDRSIKRPASINNFRVPSQEDVSVESSQRCLSKSSHGYDKGARSKNLMRVPKPITMKTLSVGNAGSSPATTQPIVTVTAAYTIHPELQYSSSSVYSSFISNKTSKIETKHNINQNCNATDPEDEFMIKAYLPPSSSVVASPDVSHNQYRPSGQYFQALPGNNANLPYMYPVKDTRISSESYQKQSNLNAQFHENNNSMTAMKHSNNISLNDLPRDKQYSHHRSVKKRSSSFS